MTCLDCKCKVVPDTAPVEPDVRRQGMVAVVTDAPTGAESLGRTVFNGHAGEILEATIRGVIAAAGGTASADLLDEVAVFHAVSRPTPGGKPPSIASVRACQPVLMSQLADARPRVVLSVGASACASLSGTGKATPITKWRGRMRWLELPALDEHGDPLVVPWLPTISAGSVAARTELYRDLANDVWKAWTQPAPIGDPNVHTVIPRDLDALRGALAVLDDASVVAVDVETTGLSAYRNELISVGFGADYGDGEGYAVIVPRELMSDEGAKDLCWDYVWSRSHRTVFQNGKFDMQFLSRWFGEDVPEEARIGDTLTLGYLLDERSGDKRASRLGLKEQASYRYDAEDYHWDWDKFYADMAHDGTYPGRDCDRERCKHPHPDDVERADWAGLYHYHSLDVYYTARLWFDEVDEAESEDSDVANAHEMLMPIMKTLTRCEMAGAPLDFEWLEAFAARLRRRIDRRTSALLDTVAEIGCSNESLNLDSPAEVADLMYDDWGMTPDVRKTKKFRESAKVGPDRSTDKDHVDGAILKYMSSPDPQKARGARWLRTLLRRRTDTKSLSTYSESLVARADDDGRLRASFLIHGTSTGRLSSREPNLQNIPAVDDKGYEPDGRTTYTLRGGGKTYWPARRAFAPPPGYVWVEADYSQLELRVAAWLSGDEDLIDVFVQERDIHREVAATMFSKPADQITKPERYLAKAVDFGILYGRTGKALAAGEEMDFYERELGGKRWDEATADAFIAKFLRGYPRLRAWLADTAERAVQDHFVDTPFGRRRRFPFTPRTKYERLSIERQATNTPIQSAASDLCLLAMTRIYPRLPEGATLLFPVHDSVTLEVREDVLDEVVKVLREEMEVEVGGVPLTVDVEVGASWADVH